MIPIENSILFGMKETPENRQIKETSKLWIWRKQIWYISKYESGVQISNEGRNEDHLKPQKLQSKVGCNQMVVWFNIAKPEHILAIVDISWKYFEISIRK